LVQSVHHDADVASFQRDCKLVEAGSTLLVRIDDLREVLGICFRWIGNGGTPNEDEQNNRVRMSGLDPSALVVATQIAILDGMHLEQTILDRGEDTLASLHFIHVGDTEWDKLIDTDRIEKSQLERRNVRNNGAILFDIHGV